MARLIGTANNLKKYRHQPSIQSIEIPVFLRGRLGCTLAVGILGIWCLRNC